MAGEDSNGSGENVRVFLRIRPVNHRERSSARGLCLGWDEQEGKVSTGGKQDSKEYTYDHVAGPDATQETVFQQVGKPITDTCLKGYNGTIFAYGQTGSGKTFTISGPANDQKELRGLMPRVFDYLMTRVERESRTSRGNTTYQIRASFIEIYNEKIYDLLDGGSYSLSLREEKTRGVYVEGVTEHEVTSSQDCHDLLQKGIMNRRVGETAMNRESSRSHSVYKLTIQSTHTGEDGIQTERFSQFNMIDLAGSERQKLTAAAGERLKEASQINKSLSALGNVITGLVDVSRGKHRHIPYRDSKLTFLLKQALGGNSMTYIIACVSPASEAFGETLSTLRFARRAKCIKNKAVRNENHQYTLKMLQEKNAKLMKELRLAREQNSKRHSGDRRISFSLLTEDLPASSTEEIKKLTGDLESLRKIYQMTLGQEKECRDEISVLKEKIHKIEKLSQKREHSRMAAKLKSEFCQRKLDALEKALSAEEKATEHFKCIQDKAEEIREMMGETEGKARLEEIIAEQDIIVHELKHSVEFLNELVPDEGDLLELDTKDLDAMQIVKEKCGHYRSKYQQLQSEYFGFKQGAEELIVRVEDLQVEADKSRDELKGEREKLAAASESLKQMEQSATEKEKLFKKLAQDTIDAYEKQLKERAQAASEQLDSVRKTLLDQLESTKRELTQALETSETYENDAKSLRSEVSSLKSQVQDLEEKMEIKDLEFKQTKSQLEHQEKEQKEQAISYENQITTLNSEHKEQLSKAMDEVQESYEAKLQSISAELAEIQQFGEATKTESSRLRARNGELESELHHLKQELLQEKSRVRHKAAQLHRQYSAKEILLSQKQSQILQSMEAKHERRVKSLVARHATRFNELSEKLTVETKKKDSLNNQVLQLQSFLDEARMRADSLVEDFENKCEKLEKCVKENKDMQERIETTQKELDNTKTELKTTAESLGAIREELKTVKDQLVEAKRINDKIVSENASLSSKVDTLEEQASKMSCELKQALEGAQKFEFEVVNLKEENECLNETNSFQNSKIEQLEGIVTSLSADIESKTLEIKSLSSEKEELQRRTEALKKESQKLAEKDVDIKNLMAERDDVQSRVDELLGERTNLLKEIKKQEERATALTQEQEEMKGNLEEFQNLLRSREKAHNEKSNELKQVKSQLQSAEEQLKAQETEISTSSRLVEEKDNEIVHIQKTFKDTILSLEEKVKRAEAEAASKQEQHSAEITLLKEKMSVLQSEYEKKEEEALAKISSEEVQALQKSLKKHQHAIESLEKHNQNLSEAVKDEQGRRQASQEMLDQARKTQRKEARKLRKLEEAAAKHDEEMDALKEELAKACHSRERLVKDMKACKEEEENAYSKMQELNSRCEELKEVNVRTNKKLKEMEKKMEKITNENARLIGHQNPNQKIQHHMRIKEENEMLKKRIRKLEIQSRKEGADPKYRMMLRSRKGLSERHAVKDKENVNQRVTRSSKRVSK